MISLQNKIISLSVILQLTATSSLAADPSRKVVDLSLLNTDRAAWCNGVASGEISSYLAEYLLKRELEAKRLSLSQLITPDADGNFLYLKDYASDIWNDDQYAVAIATSKGYTETYDVLSSNSPPLVRRYRFYHDGIAEVGGKFAVGNEQVIDNTLGFLLLAGARVDAGASVPIMEGPRGAGKSSVVKLNAAGEKTFRYLEGHYQLTYEWDGLDEIPGIKTMLPGLKPGQMISCPIGHSPFVLYNPARQEEILEQFPRNMSNAMKHFGDHSAAVPKPERHACPHCDFYRKELFAYYQEQKATQMTEAGYVHTHGATDHSLLTPKEEEDILNRHVRVKHYFRVAEGSSVPKVDPLPPGTDIMQTLFFVPNPLVGQLKNPNHPLAVNPTGLLHRGSIYLEEIARQTNEALNALLGPLQDREVRFGPHVWRIQGTMLGSTNAESVRAAMESGTNMALVDRLLLELVKWVRRPDQIQQVLLLGFSDLVLQKSLAAVDAPWEKLHIPTLYPPINSPVPYPTPLGRYALKIMGVTLEPALVEFLGEAMALTMMITDKAKTGGIERMDVVNHQVFSDPLTRLQFLRGNLTEPELTEASSQELVRLLERLHEGEEVGITPRTILRLFAKTLIAGRTIPNRFLTVRELATDLEVQIGSGWVPDLKDESEIAMALERLELAYQQYYIRLRNTVFAAHIKADADFTYLSVVEEILALGKSSSALRYESKINGGGTRTIERGRLEAIRVAYAELYNGRPLNEYGINQMFAHVDFSAHDVMASKDPGLYAAIVEVLSDPKKISQKVQSIVAFDIHPQGYNHPPGIEAERDRVRDALIDAYGYTKEGWRAALEDLIAGPNIRPEKKTTSDTP